MTRFSDGSEGLNYHRWDVCAPARELGRRTGVRVYETLREAIVRRFGESFYEELEAAANYLENNDDIL